MRTWLLRLANDLRESYWFVPTVMAVAALLLAAAMVWLDSQISAHWMDGLPWLYAARPQGARSLLSSIGGSMIGVAGTTFSVTIAAVVYASGQYGPRLLSNFMSDRGNQVTLGTFIATFLYSLVVVRTIRSPEESMGEGAFVPQFALLVGIVLLLSSIGVLIYFIHHVPSQIHINTVIERIGRRLTDEIDRRFPKSIGEPLDPLAAASEIPDALRVDAPRSVAARVTSDRTGYLQLVDDDRLMEVARERGLVLRLLCQPGDFARGGTVLAEVAPADRLDEDAAGEVAGAFAFGSRRTALQDLRFLIDELVEIGARALSPGVNDPFTANSCLDWLGAALAELAPRALPSPLRADEAGALRIIAHPQSFAATVESSLGALAPYAAGDLIAGRRLLDVAEDVARACVSAERLEVLRRQVMQFRQLAEEALPAASRSKVRDHADRLLRAFADRRRDLDMPAIGGAPPR